MENKIKFIPLFIFLFFPLSLFANEVEIKPYGFLKTSVMYGNKPIVSFSNINMVAPTGAVNKESYNSGNDRTSFQVAQSRLGGEFRVAPGLSGLMEIDFIDFSQSSPTTQSRPRLRRIFIKKIFTNDFALQFGQDWDTFSPFGPDTYDIIGCYFNSGNIGFMREQIKLMKDWSKTHFEISLGQANKNSSLGNNEIEEENQISLSSQLIYSPTEHQKLAFSMITGRSSYSDSFQTPYGLSIGYQHLSENNQIKAEGYFGEGLSQLNLLDLPGINFGQSFGGFVTYQRKLGPDSFFRLGHGIAKRSKAGTSILTTQKSFSNLGMSRNQVSRFSFTQNFGRLQAYIEESYFQSLYQNNSSTLTSELGLLMPF